MLRMHGKNRFCLWVLAFGLVLLSISPAPATTDILDGAEVKASPEAVKQLVAAFGRAEKALGKEDLDSIMQFYSDDYQNRGLRKEDTSRIWMYLFENFNQLVSRHILSRIVVNPKEGTAKVTCTGALFGTSPSNIAKSATVDVWSQAIHSFTFEKGEWRIIGHDLAENGREEFSGAIHILF